MNSNPYNDAQVLQADVDDDLTLLERPPVKAARLDLAIVRIAGPDAIDFLHGQFSGDCRALPIGATMLTAWCSPKGRVLFMPRLLRATADTLYALLPTAQVQAFVKRLRMFVLRAKLTLEDCSSSHAALMVEGLDVLPNIEGDLLSARDGLRWWVIAPRAVLARVWDTLDMPALGANATQLAAIRRGEPSLDIALSDQFLPQELNLDSLAGVSFNKGCYPGQEIVARVKFRGTVKRRVQRFSVHSDNPIAPGSRLLDIGGAPHGTVLSAALTSPGHHELLAVVDLDADPLLLTGAAEPLVSLPLPYAPDGA